MMSTQDNDRTVLIRFRVSELEDIIAQRTENEPVLRPLTKQYQRTTFRRKKPVVRYATQYADGKIPRGNGPWTPTAF